MSIDEDRFRQEIRMSRSAFDRLLDLIQLHNAYHNNSSHAQYPVQLQLLLTLYRLGCFGNGVSTGKVARRFGVSEGAARLFTHRTIVAILSPEKSLVCWPSSAEKTIIKKRIENQSEFPNCLGFVDGTLAVLESRPSLHGSDYSGRKNKYGSFMLIVCDDQRRIRYLFTGFCGSVHDNSVLKESKLGMETYSFNSSIDCLIVWFLIAMSCKIDCSFVCLFDWLIDWFVSQANHRGCFLRKQNTYWRTVAMQQHQLSWRPLKNRLQIWRKTWHSLTCCLKFGWEWSTVMECLRVDSSVSVDYGIRYEIRTTTDAPYTGSGLVLFYTIFSSMISTMKPGPNIRDQRLTWAAGTICGEL